MDTLIATLFLFVLFYSFLTNLVERGRKAQYGYESVLLKIREVDLQDPRFVGGLFLCPNRIPMMAYRRSQDTDMTFRRTGTVS